MADALGVADPDAMHGMLRQLVRASVKGEKPDAVNLAFMISMIKSIKPRDAVEAMLVAQMVSVHVMTMRCAHHLASAEDVAQQDSAARALGRLARTFPAQIEALNRHRSHGEPAITVQNVSVGGWRQRHCRQRHAACERDRLGQEPGVRGAEAPKAAGRPGDGANPRTPGRTHSRERSRPHTGPMLASPRCGAKTRSGGACRSPAVHGKKRCRMHGGAPGSGPPKGKPERAQARPVHEGRDRRAKADSGRVGGGAEVVAGDEVIGVRKPATRKPCNTYLGRIRIARDPELQGEICRSDP